MREILFRGKSIEGGFWVEGSLRITTHQPTNGKPYKCYEIEDTTYGEFPDDFMSGICEPVDPETVGQYTGMKDKNGKNIFEGDIVSLRTGRKHEVKWKDGAFCMIGTAIPISRAGFFEIIGNIHDNPELLEV